MTTPTQAEREARLREQQRRFLREAARVCDWTTTELARAAGLAPSTINRFLNQEVGHVLSTKTQAALLSAIEQRLASFDDAPVEETLARLRRLVGAAPALAVPGLAGPGLQVCGAVQAGAFTEAVEWPEDERYQGPVAADPRYSRWRQFLLEVRGNSMDLVYPDHSFVVCVRFLELQRMPQVAELVVVLRRDRHHDGYEATLKELRQAPDGSYWLWPRSSDPSHQPVKLEGFDDGSADNDDLVVWALVVGGYRAEPDRAPREAAPPAAAPPEGARETPRR